MPSKGSGRRRRTGPAVSRPSNMRRNQITASPLGGASVFLLTTAITLKIYADTTSRSIAGGDAGELVAEGCALGTSHPPGYPLYTLIVYLITSLGKSWCPTLSPAYLVNMTSCAFGSISSGLIGLVVFNLTANEGGRSPAVHDNELYLSSILRCAVGLSTGLMASFSPLMWQYNTSAEVFSLHNFFVSLLVYALAIYSSRPSSAPMIALGSFLCGIGLTNQHTSILLIVPVASWVFYNSSMWKKPKLLLLSASSFMLGISLYALLPLFAVNYPHAGSWGDLTTLRGFIHHFLRRDYGTLQLYSGDDASSEGMVERTLSWASDFIGRQLGRTSLMLLTPLFGFASGFDLLGKGKGKRVQQKRGRCTDQNQNDPSRMVAKILLLALVCYLAVFHSLSNLPLSNDLLYGIHQRFWMHPNILSFILIGIGMHKSIVIASDMAPSRVLALVGVVLLLPAASYRRNYGDSDQSANDYFRKYAMSILETLPKDSLLLINYDQQWTSVRYMQECEGVRGDITSINLSMTTFEWWESKRALYEGSVVFPGTHYTRGNTLPWLNGGYTFSEFIDANVEHFGSHIFIGGRLNFEDPTFDEKYTEVPFGLVRRIRGRDRASESAEAYRTRSLLTWRVIANHLASDLPREEKYPRSTWEWTIRREFFDHLVSRSTHLLDLALNEMNDFPSGKPGKLLPSIVDAAAWLELASSWDDSQYAQQSSMKKNLGLAYMNIVRSKESGGFPFVEDIFNEASMGDAVMNETVGIGVESGHKRNWWTGDGGGSWKEWASDRWRDEWGTFLELESSKSDPGYSQVKTIYEAVMNSSSLKANSRLPRQRGRI